MHLDAILALDEFRAAMVQVNQVRLQLLRLGGEDLMQVSPVQLGIGRAMLFQMIFGEFEALQNFARVMQAEDIGAGAHAHRVKLIAKAERAQHMHAIGAELDARADFAELRSLLIDFHIMASLQKADRRRKPTQTRAHENDLLAFHANSLDSLQTSTRNAAVAVCPDFEVLAMIAMKVAPNATDRPVTLERRRPARVRP